MNRNEEYIENFIRDHKDEFEKYCIDNFHEERFLSKLYKRFKKVVSIVPYLIKVLIVTIIVFALSISIWNTYIRKDRNDVTLKQKIENIIKYNGKTTTN